MSPVEFTKGETYVRVIGAFLQGPQLQSLTCLGLQYEATVSRQRSSPRFSLYAELANTKDNTINDVAKVFIYGKSKRLLIRVWILSINSLLTQTKIIK